MQSQMQERRTKDLVRVRIEMTMRVYVYWLQYPFESNMKQLMNPVDLFSWTCTVAFLLGNCPIGFELPRALGLVLSRMAVWFLSTAFALETEPWRRWRLDRELWFLDW